MYMPTTDNNLKKTTKNKMKILVIEPFHVPKVKEIEKTLEAMQKVVGDYFQVVYPFDDSIALICNEEGKSLGLPPNRALRDENGKVYDIVCGTFFLCSAPPDDDDFYSLSDEQIKYYTKLYRHPELFF